MEGKIMKRLTVVLALAFVLLFGVFSEVGNAQVCDSYSGGCPTPTAECRTTPSGFRYCYHQRVPTPSATPTATTITPRSDTSTVTVLPVTGGEFVMLTAGGLLLLGAGYGIYRSARENS